MGFLKFLKRDKKKDELASLDLPPAPPTTKENLGDLDLPPAPPAKKDELEGFDLPPEPPSLEDFDEKTDLDFPDLGKHEPFGGEEGLPKFDFPEKGEVKPDIATDDKMPDFLNIPEMKETPPPPLIPPVSVPPEPPTPTTRIRANASMSGCICFIVFYTFRIIVHTIITNGTKKKTFDNSFLCIVIS